MKKEIDNVEIKKKFRSEVKMWNGQREYMRTVLSPVLRSVHINIYMSSDIL